jgi:lysophospholipase L1-like esterase
MMKKNLWKSAAFLAALAAAVFIVAACDNGDDTPPPGPKVVDIKAVGGVTAPVTGEKPVTSVTATAQYTGTVSWAPAVTDNKFAASTDYTATITLKAKTDYTLTGVKKDFFTVQGATATNAANKGVITAVFPATIQVYPEERAVNALLKLKNGQNITFAAIGGSITQGGCVTGVYDWLNKKAPGKVNYVNAGIGASDSGLGLLRFDDHVLRHNPDIVVIEYSVNDSYMGSENGNKKQFTYEGIVRQALKNSDRAVFLLLMNTGPEGNSKSNSTHTTQRNIGENYNLPVFRWMDYAGVKGKWEDSGLFNWTGKATEDSTHPNAAGNASVAKGITDYLDKIWNKLPDAAPAIDKTLPAAKYLADYEKISYIGWNGSGVTPGVWTEFSHSSMVQSSSWDQLSTNTLKAYTGFFIQDNDTSELTINFKGSSVYIVSTFIKDQGYTGYHGDYGGPHGSAWVAKNGGGDTSPVKVGSNSWYGPDWFGTQVATGLDPSKEHTLYIKGATTGKINVWGAIVGGVE